MASVNSTQLRVADYIEFKAAEWIWIVMSPILIIVGTIGNLMSILVLTRPTMRKSTVSIYLTVLSLCDILVLYTGLLRQCIRYHTKFDIRSLSDLSCKINTTMVYFTLDFSVWILVAVTVERILSVWFPHRVRYTCTVKSSIVTLTVIAMVLLAINSHFLFGIGVVTTTNNNTITSSCKYLLNDYRQFAINTWPWIDLCFFCLFPFTILIIGNLSIIVKVYAIKRKKERHALQGTRNPQQVTSNKNASSITAMLLCLNMVFLLCTSPISVYIIGEPHWLTDNSDAHERAQHSLVWAIVNMLMYTNNSINFILYCVSGSKFREEVNNIFKKTNSIRPQMSVTRANGVSNVHQPKSNTNKPDPTHLMVPKVDNNTSSDKGVSSVYTSNSVV